MFKSWSYLAHLLAPLMFVYNDGTDKYTTKHNSARKARFRARHKHKYTK